MCNLGTLKQILRTSDNLFFFLWYRTGSVINEVWPEERDQRSRESVTLSNHVNQIETLYKIDHSAISR